MTQDPDQPAERFHRDRREHGGSPDEVPPASTRSSSVRRSS